MTSVIVYSPVWRGGAGWFVQALAQSIAEAGGEVTYIGPLADPVEREPDHSNVRRMILPQGAGGSGSKPYRAARSLCRVLLTFPTLLRARLRSREFILTFYDWLFVLALQMVWIRVIGGRLTYIVHDATPHAWGFPERWRWIERALLRFSYRMPNRLVALTEIARRELISTYGVAEDRVSVIPHGAFTSGNPTELTGEGKVLVFGMLRRNKRILESLLAMEQLPAGTKLRMIIAGAPHAEDPEYWRECAAVADRLGGTVRTEIGFVPEARVAELLTECDAVLLPYEEFNSQSGVAILSAFAERVLICTDAGGIGELIGFGLEPVRVSRPVEAATIADALLRFEAFSVAERRAMTRRSRERLEGRLSWRRIGESYLRLVEGGAS